MALTSAATAVGAHIALPFRLPHGPGQRPSDRISIGEGAFIGPGAFINILGQGRFSVGEHTAIGADLMISAGSLVEIGPGVLMSARISLVDSLHDIDAWMRDARATGSSPRFDWRMTQARPIRIGEGSLIGVNVVVLPGVTIGSGCAVGANSVVTRDVPDNTVVAGSPARVVRTTGADPAV